MGVSEEKRRRYNHAAPPTMHFVRDRWDGSLVSVIRIEQRISPLGFVNALLSSIVDDYPRADELPDPNTPTARELQQRVRESLHEIGNLVHSWDWYVYTDEAPAYLEWGWTVFERLFPGLKEAWDADSNRPADHG